MAEMGLGYGSEFQLLRFLGHHRDELNELIHESTGMSGAIHWKDFGYDDNRICGDRELKGIECFNTIEKEKQKQIKKNWECFWPQSGSSMNWDAIFTIDDTWFFVEAKAREAEAFQKCSATSDKSKTTIATAFDETKTWLGLQNDINWIKTDCYQLANRLAFIYFCSKNGIKAKLLYVSFINGYHRKSVTSRDLWEKVWNEQFETLGINPDSVKDLIYHIYPNCEPNNK